MIRLIFTSIIFLISLVCFPQAKAGRTEQQAKQRIDSVYAMAQQGQTLRLLARMYSEDPGSAMNGGMYDSYEVGSMDADFEKTVLSLKPGEISKPFKTRFGYHIAELTGRQGNLFSCQHVLITFDP